MRSSISLIFVAAAASLSLVSANPEPTPMAGMVRRHRHHELAQRGPLEELNESHLEKRAYSGSATFYEVQTGNAGACGSYLSRNDYVVALAQPLWGNLNVKSPLCGKTITISANGKSTQATIMDACPTGGGNCGGPDLDMSQSLFEFFNPISVGKFPISWSLGGGGGGGGGSSHSSGGGNDNNDNSEADRQAKADAAASRKAAAAASSKSAAAQSSKDAKSAAAASKSSASVASVSSVSAASASRSSASVASVASVSSASHYSVTRAAAQSSSSVASVKSAQSKASKASAASSSKSAANAWASEKARPQNLDNFDAIVKGMSKMVQGAHN